MLFLMFENMSNKRNGRASSQTRSKATPQIRIWSKPISDSKEQMEILEKVKISSQFGMRKRGLFEFYGDELIAYKREKPKCSNRNKFLHFLSTYFTEYLEDNCPTSWQECHSLFWEEFLFAFYPTQLTITPNEKEVETFLFELKKFTRWLDRKIGTSSYKLINQFIAESKDDLLECEYLLNQLLIHAYPEIFENKRHVEFSDLYKLKDVPDYENYKKLIFEIKEINNELVIASDIYTNINYLIEGMPPQILSPSILIYGVIGQNNGELIWTWQYPEHVMPLRTKKFIIGL